MLGVPASKKIEFPFLAPLTIRRTAARGLRVPRPDFLAMPFYRVVNRRNVSNFKGTEYQRNDEPFGIPSRGPRRGRQGYVAYAPRDPDNHGTCYFHGPARQPFFRRCGSSAALYRHRDSEYRSLAHVPIKSIHLIDKDAAQNPRCMPESKKASNFFKDRLERTIKPGALV